MRKIVKFIFLIFFGFYGCSPEGTPYKYRNTTKVPIEIYKTQKKVLISKYKMAISTKHTPYFQHYFDSSTDIFIDTIIYSPQKDKFATIIIAKNLNAKIKYEKNLDGYYYNAFLNVGLMDTNYNILNMHEYGNIYIDLYPTYKSASKSARYSYFTELHDSYGVNYNLDDIRIWDNIY